MVRMSVVLAAACLCVGFAAGAEEKPTSPADVPAGPQPNIGTINDWIVSSNDAKIRDGMMYLDALNTKDAVYAFRKDKAFRDTKLTVQFKLDPVGTGERSVGLIFGSTDGQTYHSVKVDRSSVILYEHRVGQPPRELARRGGFTKPDGNWYEARVETSGPQIKVFFDDRFLFAFNSPQLQPGYVGVYANAGRAWVRRLDADGTPARLPQVWRPR